MTVTAATTRGRRDSVTGREVDHDSGDDLEDIDIDEKAQEAEVESESEDTLELRRQKLVEGDYVVQVHIIEARDLKGRGWGDMSDPVVNVSVMGKKQSSNIKKSCLSAVWDQVLVFEFKKLEVEQLVQGRATISVMDANTIMRDVMIGMYEFDLSSVYFSPDHEVYRQWVALTDVADDHEGIQGYLRLSITVLGPNDEQKVHPPAEEDEEETNMLTVLMPPEIEQEPKLLTISLYQCRDLPEMDVGILSGEKCDPFCWVEFAGVRVRSKVRKGTNPDMCCEMQIPVMEPIMSRTIKLSFFDWNAATRNERIATLLFDYEKIKEEDGLDPQWYSMFGAPHGKNRGLARKMNKGIVPGTFYRGQALIAAEVTDENEPKKGMNEIGLPRKSLMPKETQYFIQFDLYEGSEIVDLSGWSKTMSFSTTDMHVELHIGKIVTTSRRVPVRNGRTEWYECLTLKDKKKSKDGDQTENLGPITLCKDTTQCPDVFVYLCNGNNRLSYARFKFKDIVDRNWRVPPEWHNLKEDKALDNLQENVFPGTLLFSLRAGLVKEVPATPHPVSRPFVGDGQYAQMQMEHHHEHRRRHRSSVDSMLTPPMSPPKVGELDPAAAEEEPLLQSPETQELPTIGHMSIWIQQAQALPVGDASGTSDPYVKVVTTDKDGKLIRHQTSVIKKNLNPKWYQRFDFKYIPSGSTLALKVFDEDRLSADDTLGEVELTIQAQSNKPPGESFDVKNWYFINRDYPDAKVQVRIKYDYLPPEIKARKTLSTGAAMLNTLGLRKSKMEKVGHASFGHPFRKSMQLRAHIYQGRNIDALDANGLCDPYVVVRLAGQTAKTSVCDQTCNPIWYETKLMNVMLPKPLTLAPDIQVVVYDHDLMNADDYAGRFSVRPADIQRDVGAPQPRWYRLTDADGNDKDGEILAAFQVLDVDNIDKVPRLVPPSQAMWLQIVTLGLRELNSTMGVHKPYIEFTMPNGRAFKTKRSNRPEARNPNFLQVLKIPVQIPLDPIFAPTLTFTVKDALFGGLVKRSLGTGHIKFQDFMGDNVLDQLEKQKLIKQAKDAERKRKKEEQEAMKIEAAARRRLMQRTTSASQVELLERNTRPSLVELLESPKQRLVKDRNLQPSEGSLVRLDVRDISDEEDEKLSLVSASQQDEKSAQALLQKTQDAKLDFAPLEISDHGDSDSFIGSEERSVADLLAAPGSDEEDGGSSSDSSSSTEFDLEQEQKTQAVDHTPEYMRGRQTFDDELEDKVNCKPFVTFKVATGQKNAMKFVGKRYREVGYMKGIVQIAPLKNSPLPIDTRSLLRPKNLFVRLYVLRGFHLTPKDRDGTCDPYLVIKMGRNTISTRSRYIANTLEPEFFEAFEIPCTVPGSGEMKIECWDWDGIGDDLVGVTSIDIEDRWFSQDWRALKPKPVEMRTLRSPVSSFSQGKLELWMEILDGTQTKISPMLSIKPPPPEPYELRVIVWECKDMTIKDAITEQNDLYVSGILDQKGVKKQYTDTHLRSKGGKGSFNWRMKFPVQLPTRRPPRFRIAVWDKDFFSASDSICEANLSLTGLFRRAFAKKDRVVMSFRGSDKIWINDLRHPNFAGNQGRIQVSFECMPQSVANQLPAGYGRSQPNMNPVLPDPEGRTKFSILHPFATLRAILGDRLYFKLISGFLIAALCSFLMMFGPSLASNLVSMSIMGMGRNPTPSPSAGSEPGPAPAPGPEAGKTP